MSWREDRWSYPHSEGTSRAPYLPSGTWTAVCGRRAGPVWNRAECRAIKVWETEGSGGRTESWKRMKKRRRMEGMMCMCVEREAEEGTLKWLSKGPCPWTSEKKRQKNKEEYWTFTIICHFFFFLLTSFSEMVSLSVPGKQTGDTQGTAKSSYKLKQPIGSCYHISDKTLKIMTYNYAVYCVFFLVIHCKAEILSRLCLCSEKCFKRNCDYILSYQRKSYPW